MGINYKNFTTGLSLEAKASSDNASAGDLDVSSGKLNYHNGTSSSPVVTESHSATLTNKLIDLTNNTLTGTSAELATAISDETGSGLLVFNNTPSLTTPQINDAVNLTTTSTKLNYLTSATGTTGNSATNVVFSGSTGNGPTITDLTVNKITATTSGTSDLNIYATGGASFYSSFPAKLMASYDGSNFAFGNTVNVVLNNNFQSLYLKANAAATNSYTVEFPAIAPTADTYMKYDGSTFVWEALGNLKTINGSTTQDLAIQSGTGRNITLNSDTGIALTTTGTIQLKEIDILTGGKVRSDNNLILQTTSGSGGTIQFWPLEASGAGFGVAQFNSNGLEISNGKSIKFYGLTSGNVSLSAQNTTATYSIDLPNKTPFPKETYVALNPDGFGSSWESFINNNKSLRMMTAIANSTSLSLYGMVSPTALGTATAVAPAMNTVYSSKKIIEYLAASSSTSVASWRMTDDPVIQGSGAFGGYKFSAGFGFADGFGAAQNPTTKIFFVGLANLTAAPSPTTNPSVQSSVMIGVGLDASDTTLQFMVKRSTGVATKFDTGLPRPTANKTNFYKLDIAGFDSNYWLRITDLNTSTTFTISDSFNLPNQIMYARAYIANGSVGSTSVGLAMEYMTLDSSMEDQIF